MLDQYRWWHTLRGHGRPRTVQFDPAEFEREMRRKGYSQESIHQLMPVVATKVVTRCPGCKDEWVFNALIFAESYVPGGGVLDYPDLRPVGLGGERG